MTMPKCTLCFKARSEVNNEGVCWHCEKKLSRQENINISVKRRSTTMMTPFLASGRILPKEKWSKIKSQIDRFYNSVSMEEIEEFNANVKASRSSEKDSQSIDAGFIYLLESNVGYYKIGKTINVTFRVGQHLRNYPVSLDVIHVIPVTNMTKCESWLLSKFQDKRLQGEWFALSKEEVEWIMSLTPDNIVDYMRLDFAD